MGCCCSAPDVGHGDHAGGKYKTHMTQRQALVFREIEHFGPLKQMKTMFNSVDRDGSGSIDAKEFLALLNLTPNVYTNRLLELFDSDADNTISLAEFVIGMARFK